MKIKNTVSNITIKRIKIIGYIGYIELYINSSQDQREAFPDHYSRRMRFAIEDDGREYYANTINYWIDNSHSLYNNDSNNVNINKSATISLNINLLDGKIISGAYTKSVKIKMYDTTEGKELVWESPKIDLVSKKIDLPKLNNKVSFSGDTIINEVDLVWDTIADFNYSSKAYILTTEVFASNTFYSLRKETKEIERSSNTFEIKEMNPTGSYIVQTVLSYRDGNVISIKETIVEQERDTLPISVKTSEGIKKITGAYIKTESGIKKITELKVK